MRPRASGSVLLVSLWLLVLLTLVSCGAAHQALQALRLTRARRDYRQAMQDVKTGLARAVAQLDQRPVSTTSPQTMRDDERGAATVVWRVIDEEAKVNLNTIALQPDGPQLLQQLPGMTPALAASIVARVRAAPLVHLEELWWIDGVQAELWRQWRPLLTVTSDGRLNLNTASRDALLLVGMEPPLADRVIEARRYLPQASEAGHPAVEWLTVSAIRALLERHGMPLTDEQVNQLSRLLAPPPRLTARSTHFTLIATGIVRRGAVRATAEALFERTPERLRLLTWYEH